MTNNPDFGPTLTAALGLRDNFYGERNEAVLTARFVELCPDCGVGVVLAASQARRTCTHPDAPTIGVLLAEAVRARRAGAEFARATMAASFA